MCADYIFSFASSATKKLSESVVETAQSIKKSVEEGKIDGIIDKACCVLFSLVQRVVQHLENRSCICLRLVVAAILCCPYQMNMCYACVFADLSRRLPKGARKVCTRKESKKVR